MKSHATLPDSLSCFCACLAWADQVTLTNGDRITGSILHSDTKTLVMKTDTAGEVTLKWDSIAAISAPALCTSVWAMDR